MITEQLINARTLSPSDWKLARANALTTAYRKERGLERTPTAATTAVQPEPLPASLGTTANSLAPPPPSAPGRFDARTLTHQEYTARRREILGGR